MNSLYELDPKWKKLLKTDNFLGGLTVNEFVQELSKDHRNDVLIDANTKIFQPMKRIRMQSERLFGNN